MNPREKAYDPGDEAQVKVRKRKAQTQREGEINDWKSLMDTQFGRRAMTLLLTQCGVYRSSFATNALEMAKSEGQRNMGLWLMSELEGASPSDFLLMLNEASKQKEIDNA